jgi:hypothetical protein
VLLGNPRGKSSLVLVNEKPEVAVMLDVDGSEGEAAREVVSRADESPAAVRRLSLELSREAVTREPLSPGTTYEDVIIKDPPSTGNVVVAPVADASWLEAALVKGGKVSVAISVDNADAGSIAEKSAVELGIRVVVSVPAGVADGGIFPAATGSMLEPAFVGCSMEAAAGAGCSERGSFMLAPAGSVEVAAEIAD